MTKRSDFCTTCTHFHHRPHYEEVFSGKKEAVFIGECRHAPPAYSPGNANAFPRLKEGTWCSLWRALGQPESVDVF